MQTNILVVGADRRVTETLGVLLAPRGWRCMSCDTIHEAERALADGRFDVTLALESLRDGRGYELSRSIVRQLRSLFVGVPLSESCLWLPVVQNGEKVLGRRAVGPTEIGLEIEHLVGEHATQSDPVAVSCGPLSSRKQRRVAPGLALRPGATLHPPLRRASQQLPADGK
jgi:hypothetical protein